MHYVAITSEGKEDGVPLKDELEAAVYDIVRASWAKRNGYLVPEPSDLQLGNDAVNLRAAVLYADLQDSTKLVDTQLNTTAAEVYKSYMVCAARIIKNEGGSVTAYDGDRIMGVFLGDTKSDAAAKSALRINWALGAIVNPYLKRIYGESAYQAKHVIGVDMSNILACRIGVRNDNDLVWIGRAANYAAKLSAINENFPVYITGDVFDELVSAKYGGQARQLMWEQRTWTNMNFMRLYRSNWTWSL